MGFIEETGAAQHYRDARIAAIYEGTNGIQALDLVTRKMPLQGGKTVALYLDELRSTVADVQASNAPGFGETAARLSRSGRQSRARHAMAAGAEGSRMPRSPAPRLICACSAMPPAAACWPSRRSPRCASAPTAPGASRWRASSPRTSPCRPWGWSAGDRRRRQRHPRASRAGGVTGLTSGLDRRPQRGDCRFGSKTSGAMHASVMAIVTHQPRSKAARRSSGEWGWPTTATKIATPSARPVCRVMLRMPEPVAKDDAGGSAVRAAASPVGTARSLRADGAKRRSRYAFAHPAPAALQFAIIKRGTPP